MICINDFCVTPGTGIGLTILLVLIVIIGIAAAAVNKRIQDNGAEYEYRPPVSDEPEFEDDVPEDDFDHPYPVGTRILAGEFEGGHQAFFVIKEYDEDESEINCRVLVEIPSGATNVFIHHRDDDNWQLGIVFVNYQIGYNAFENKVYLSNEELEDCSYDVIINACETIGEDLTSTL